MKVTIRTASLRDLPALVTIKHDAGLAAWPHILPAEVLEALSFPPRWETAIASRDRRISVLLAVLDERPVGFAITQPSGDADASPATGELDGFYSDPAAWGAGAGRALLAAAVATLRTAGFGDATLWTATLNHRPRRIYETAGWRVDGTERVRSLGGVAFTEVRYRIALGEEA
ncbi:MAG: GNAT family N-acetyltransferase [Chloroflexota bacterium]|nr:GNAT family N-acetyltransferase [Chloroflexota bacterium]